MITNDERRRVADAVRGIGEKFYSQETWDELRASLGFVDGDGNTDEIMARIADLIDPDCDREALLALADEMDAYTRCSDDNRCGRQMPPLAIHEFATRIREACGEVRP